MSVVFYQDKFIRDIVKNELRTSVDELLAKETLQGVSIRTRGNWVSGREYVNNNQFIDVVYYEKTGCTYTCVTTHRSSSSLTPDNDTYWTVMSKDGADGADGKDAQSVFISTVFKAAPITKAPSKPSSTEGSFLNPVPSGWSDGIPSIDLLNPIIYMSKRKFTSDGVGQDGEWSEPIMVFDTPDMDVCFHPATSNGNAPDAPTSHGKQGDTVTTWHDAGNSNDVWMAVSNRVAGSSTWTDWCISKIKGEKGADGANGKDGADGKDGMSIDYVGDWATGNKYIVGDVVVYYYRIGKNNDGSFLLNYLYEYICIADNTSSEDDMIEYKQLGSSTTQELDRSKWKISRPIYDSPRSINSSLPLT